MYRQLGPQHDGRKYSQSLGQGTFKAYSAGSRLKGSMHADALDTLSDYQYDTAGLRSKSWDEFARSEAPPLDCVITLCDDAAQQACPVMPGRSVSAHWGLPDLAAVDGYEAEQEQAFVDVLQLLTQRMPPWCRFILLTGTLCNRIFTPSIWTSKERNNIMATASSVTTPARNLGFFERYLTL